MKRSTDNSHSFKNLLFTEKQKFWKVSYCILTCFILCIEAKRYLSEIYFWSLPIVRCMVTFRIRGVSGWIVRCRVRPEIAIVTRETIVKLKKKMIFAYRLKLYSWVESKVCTARLRVYRIRSILRRLSLYWHRRESRSLEDPVSLGSGRREDIPRRVAQVWFKIFLIILSFLAARNAAANMRANWDAKKTMSVGRKERERCV